MFAAVFGTRQETLGGRGVSLLVVGSIAFDSIETPHGSVDDALGGSASFFSYAASFFTTPECFRLAFSSSSSPAASFVSFASSLPM